MIEERTFWDENSFVLSILAIGAAWALLTGLVLLPPPPSPRDVAIQEIASLQRTAVEQQVLTNQLLRDLIKAQERGR